MPVERPTRKQIIRSGLIIFLGASIAAIPSERFDSGSTQPSGSSTEPPIGQAIAAELQEPEAFTEIETPPVPRTYLGWEVNLVTDPSELHLIPAQTIQHRMGIISSQIYDETNGGMGLSIRQEAQRYSFAFETQENQRASLFLPIDIDVVGGTGINNAGYADLGKSTKIYEMKKFDANGEFEKALFFKIGRIDIKQPGFDYQLFVPAVR